MPFATTRAETYAPIITIAFAEFGIDTPKRQSAFLAQIAHESGELKYTAELGPAAYFDKYEGRLGNIHIGDGARYKGRGLIQITGRRNYELCGAGLGLDLIASPELLQAPIEATRSACWFWTSNDLNKYADFDQFGTITKKINGGFNGLDDRLRYWLTARKILGL